MKAKRRGRPGAEYSQAMRLIELYDRANVARYSCIRASWQTPSGSIGAPSSETSRPSAASASWFVGAGLAAAGKCRGRAQLGGQRLAGSRRRAGHPHDRLHRGALGGTGRAFLASSPLAERPLDTWDRRVILGPDHEFWDPESVPTLRTAETIYPGARGFQIGVDERTPGRGGRLPDRPRNLSESFGSRRRGRPIPSRLSFNVRAAR